MRYLVEMKLSSSVRSTDPKHGIQFIERYILPTLEMCRKWRDEGKLVAGGPVVASIHLVLVLDVESVQEAESLVEGLPVWPLMETDQRTYGRCCTRRPRQRQH